MSDIQKLNNQLDYIVLDGSASMSTKWTDAKKAIDSYISILKAEHINSNVYLHLFSSGNDVDLCAFNDHLSSWESCMGIELPCGSTPLYDAISLMGQRMRAFDPERGAITIVTDGEEAGSQFTDIHQAKAILDWCRAKGWKVTFIGCDFANADQAKLLGAGDGSAVGVAQARLTDAAEALGKKRAHHARTGDDIEFSSDEQQQFGGYLAPPKK